MFRGRLPARQTPAPGARLFRAGLSGAVLARRYDAGERIHTQPATDGVPAGQELLFLLRRNGRLVPVLQGEEPTLEPGDVAVLIGGSSGASAQAARGTGSGGSPR